MRWERVKEKAVRGCGIKAVLEIQRLVKSTEGWVSCWFKSKQTKCPKNPQNSQPGHFVVVLLLTPWVIKNGNLSTLHIHYKGIFELCWILATIITKNFNSLVQKNHLQTNKNSPVLFVAVWQMWFVSGISSCSIPNLAFSGLWMYKAVSWRGGCVVKYGWSKISWKKKIPVFSFLE